MPSILVIEQEGRSLEWIQAALAPEGWQVLGVRSPAEALQAAASEAPDLVLIDAAVAGAASVAGTFSRAGGGPGLVALTAAGAPAGFAADAVLGQPFSVDALLAAVHRLAADRRAAPLSPTAPLAPLVPTAPIAPTAPTAPTASARDQKLTSRDIFGDMLAEVESEVAGLAPGPTAPPSPRPPSTTDDVHRKLEQTLSGVLNVPPRPRPAPPPRRSENGDAEVDALISKTLSGLELGSRPAAGPRPPARPVSPPPAAAAPPEPQPPQPLTPRPVPPPAAPPAPPAETRRGKPVGDFDFSEIEELARTSRRPEPPRPAAAPAPPPTPAPTPQPAAPRPAAQPAPPPPAVRAPAPPVAPAPPPPQPTPPPPAAQLATQRIEVFSAAQKAGDQFGQYTLLEKIATGGMAEVWKARSRGVEGFQKTVAIKKILPHLTDNAEFIGMFIDEAKLAAQLSHPNIIHIYDLGKIGRDYYIAMEYVEGKDLRSILNAGNRKGLPLPAGLALLIATRLASALDHAHRTRDFEGRELGLVHRDVSPQNVLISQDGDIKLCDFGIAKAVSKANNQTQMGALKGKLQYMSPEQAWGKPVDARSDIFSLGSILYELLTGERLFAGDSEISVLEAVREGRIRSPRQTNPTVSEDADLIVRRALALEPADRFANAGEMQGRLETVLYSLRPTPSHSDLAAYLRRLFDLDPGAEAAAPPAAVAAAAVAPEPRPAPAVRSEPRSEPRSEQAAEPRAEPRPAASAPPAPAPWPLDRPPGEDADTAPDEAPEALAPMAPIAPLVEVTEERSSRGRTLLMIAILVLLLVGAVVTYVLTRSRSTDPQVGPTAAPAEAARPAPVAAPPTAVPSPAPAAAPGAAPGATPAAALDTKSLENMVDEQVARQEAELRRKLEAQAKQLERELARSREKQKASGEAPAAEPPASPPPR
jgi:serine/threonine protein kinase/CheY-like chemotaxis protein